MALVATFQADTFQQARVKEIQDDSSHDHSTQCVSEAEQPEYRPRYVTT